MKTCVIFNPTAGSAGDPEELKQRLSRLGRTELRATANCGDATRFARQAVERGCELVIAAGGDGTLNEVINGIGENGRNTRVGLLPLGTGNDFARTLKLSDNLEACIGVLTDGRTMPVDLVRVTSDQVRYFVNVSAGGFSGLVDEQLTADVKQNWGPLAYIRSAAAALSELRAYKTTVRLDDNKSFELSLYNVIVGNGRYVAGGIPVAPEAVIDDGLLDLVLIPERPAAEIAMTVAKIMLGTHLESDGAVFERAAKIAVNSTPGMWFNVDGELVGNEPAVFEVIPGALNFVVPSA